MVWQPKSTSPATFNLADAFLALVTGDAQWGWLVDWMPYITNDHFDTAQFCAFGPTPAPDLSIALAPSMPDRSPISGAAKVVTAMLSVGLAARDRVFGAYCEQPGVAGVMTWGPVVCGSMAAPASAGGWVFLTTDTHAPWDSLRVVSVVSGGGSAGPVTIGTGTAAAALRSIGSFGSGGTSVPYETGGAAPAGDTSVWITQAGGGPTSATVCVQFGKLGAAITHDPTPQPEPAGTLSPLHPVDSTLDGIAAEVRLLEFKLDTLLTILQAVAGDTLDLGGDASDPTDVAPNTDIQIKDAAGVVLEASGIPASRSLDFGTPQHIVKLARLNVGNVDGWYPSVWITHSPFVLRPLPQGVTKMTVTDITPGVSITSRLIAKTK
jgi:hypothetical protein